MGNMGRLGIYCSRRADSCGSAGRFSVVTGGSGRFKVMKKKCGHVMIGPHKAPEMAHRVSFLRGLQPRRRDVDRCRGGGGPLPAIARSTEYGFTCVVALLAPLSCDTAPSPTVLPPVHMFVHFLFAIRSGDGSVPARPRSHRPRRRPGPSLSAGVGTGSWPGASL